MNTAWRRAIKAAMSVQGLSPEALRRKARIPSSTFYGIYGGQFEPSMQTARKLVKAGVEVPSNLAA